MDRSHKLDAPDNENLKTIEQLTDRSELSGLYRMPGVQFQGDLISSEEREKRRSEKDRAITLGIRKEFVAVGFFGMLPPALLAALVGAVSPFIGNKEVLMVGVIGTLIGFLIWVFIARWSLKKYGKIFYSHSLSAATVFFFQAIITMLASYSVFALTVMPMDATGPSKILAAGGILLVMGIIISLPLLLIWTSTKLSGGSKLLLIGLMAVASSIGIWAPLLS